MAAKAEACTPNDVLKIVAPTKSFLCSLSANTFGIDFLAFKIRDMGSKKVVFEVAKDSDAPAVEYPENFDFDQLRTIAYKFPADFLHFKTVGTTLKFRVGGQPVRNFRMIERHFFGQKLLRSYDFSFPFCIPNTTNEWESIYDMPKLTDKEVAEIIATPDGCTSDSFYFVEDKLIMHNKAVYTYLADGSSSKSTTAAATVSTTTTPTPAAAAATAPTTKPSVAQAAPAATAAAPQAAAAKKS